MKNYLRRVLALAMSIMMLIGNLPVAALADALESNPALPELSKPVISVEKGESIHEAVNTEEAGENSAATEGDGFTQRGPVISLGDVQDVSNILTFGNYDIMPLAAKTNLKFGYFLSIPSATFTSIPNSYVDGTLADGISVVWNNKTTTTGRKYLHEQTWTIPAEYVYSGKDRDGNSKDFAYAGEYNKVTITTEIPVSNLENYDFVAWYDKNWEAVDAKLNQDNPMTVQPGGTTHVNLSNPHSLDVVWGMVEANDKEYVYDGTGYSITSSDLKSAGASIPKYSFDQLIKEPKYSYKVEWYDNYTKEPKEEKFNNVADFQSLKTYSDVGVYKYTLWIDYKVEDRDCHVETSATLTILPRPVLVKVNTGYAEYTGTPRTLIGAITNPQNSSSEWVVLNNEYVISDTPADYTNNNQIKSSQESDVKLAVQEGKYGLVGLDSLVEAEIDVVYDPFAEQGKINVGTYTAKVLNTPTTVLDDNGNDVSYRYHIFTENGQLIIQQTFFKLILEKSVTDIAPENFPGRTFRFTLEQNRNPVWFRPGGGGYTYGGSLLWSSAPVPDGGISEITITLAPGQLQGSVELFLPVGQSDLNGIPYEIKEIKDFGDVYTVSYKSEVIQCTPASGSYRAGLEAPTPVSGNSGIIHSFKTPNPGYNIGKITVFNKPYFYIQNYVADLNDDNGDPVDGADGNPKNDFPGYAKAGDKVKVPLSALLTYGEVNNSNADNPGSFNDLHIVYGETGSYSDLTYANGDKNGIADPDDTSKNPAIYDPNSKYLQSVGGATAYVQVGDTIRIYWDRELLFDCVDDGRNVDAEKNSPNGYKANNIRQSEISYSTHYEMWNDLFSASDDIQGKIVRDSWQKVNAIDMNFKNSKENGYIFHSLDTTQINPSKATTIDDTDIYIDNIKGNSRDTKLYLVPTVVVRYHKVTASGIKTDISAAQDNTIYTINIIGGSTKNSRIGTTYPTSFTTLAIDKGYKGWKVGSAEETAPGISETTNYNINDYIDYATLYEANNEVTLILDLYEVQDASELTVEKEVAEVLRDGKKIDLADYKAALGDVITYKITVTNTGAQTVKDIVVTDDLTETTWASTSWNDQTPGTWKTGLDHTSGTLEMKEYVEFTTAYTVTEADIIAGSIKNVAVAEGTDEIDETVTDRKEKTVPTEDVKKAWKVSKSVSGMTGPNGEENGTYARVGDKLVYTITVTNTGNVTIDLTLDDRFLSGQKTIAAADKRNLRGMSVETDKDAATFSATELKISGLRPGETMQITYEYTVTVNDMGKNLANTAVLKGEGFNNEQDPDPSDPDGDPSTGKTWTPVENWTVEKKVGTTKKNRDTYILTAPDWVDQNGEKVAPQTELVYQVIVANTSDHDLSGMVIDDTFTIGELEFKYAISNPSGDAEYDETHNLLSIKKGAKIILVYAYTVQDSDAGKTIGNSVVVKGNPDSDGPSDEVETDVEETDPKLTVQKQVDKPVASIGDTLNYTITLKNVGNVTLYNVTLDDVFAAPSNGTLTYKSITDGYNDSLWANGDMSKGVKEHTVITKIDPDETVVITYTYVVVKADATAENLDDCKIMNQVSANFAWINPGDDADDPSGKPEKPVESTEVKTKVNSPRWEVDKQVSGMSGAVVNGEQTARIGDTLTYTITVKNTGNVQLTLDVTDSLFVWNALNPKAQVKISHKDGTQGAAADFTGSLTLDAGETATITYTYRVTKDDDQKISNTAVADGNYEDPTDDPSDSKHKDKTDTDIEAWTVDKMLSKVNNETNVEDVKVKADDELVYTVSVKNTGTVELNDLSVTDVLGGTLASNSNAPEFVAPITSSLEGASEATYTNGILSKLAVGETVYLTFKYKVQDGDKFLSNTAEASKPKYDDKGEPSPTEKTTETPDEPVKNVVYGQLRVNKLWMEGDGNTALADDVLTALLGAQKITIELVRNGSDGSSETVSGKTVQMPQSGNNPWSYLFEELPLSNDAGTVIYTYTVQEKGVANGKIVINGYTFDVTVGANDLDDTKNGFEFNVTNKLKNTEPPTEPTKTADAESKKGVEVGDTIVYTIKHTSPSSETTKATITDVLPKGLTYVKTAGSEVSATVKVKLPGGTTAAKNYTVTESVATAGGIDTVTWVIENVPPMAVIEITFTTKVTSDAAAIEGENLENDATVKQENKSGENFDQTTNKEKVPVKKPDLKITKNALEAEEDTEISAVIPGKTFRYQIEVTNNGNGKAVDIVIKDALSEYLTFDNNDIMIVDQNGNEVIGRETTLTSEPDDDGYGAELTWFIDELDIGDVATLTITVTVHAGKRKHLTDDKSDSTEDNVVQLNYVSDFDNLATITAGDKHKDKDESAEKNVKVADFIITKDAIDHPDYVASLGDVITYTLMVRNVGGVDLHTVELTDDMFGMADVDEQGVSTLKVVDAQTGEDVSFSLVQHGDSYTLTIDELEIGQEVTITYDVTVTDTMIWENSEYNDGDDIVNVVSAKAKYDDPDDETQKNKETHEHENKTFVPIEGRKRAWLVEKSVSGMSGKDENGEFAYARLGDELTYKIKVTNMSNVTLHTLFVADLFTVEGANPSSIAARLTKSPAPDSTGDATYDRYQDTNRYAIENLAPDEVIVLTYKRTVGVNDLGKKLTNAVTVTHSTPGVANEYTPDDPDDPDNPVDPSRDEVMTPVEKWDVEKQVGVIGEDGQWVELSKSGLLTDPTKEGVPVGTKLVYYITVENESDHTVYGIEIEDTFKGSKIAGDLTKVDDPNYTTTGAEYDANQHMITCLPKDGKITLQYTYEVKEADAGKTLENAVVAGNPNKPGTPSSKVETPVDKYSVTKKVSGLADNGEGEKIALPGTTLKYTIKVTNEGETVLNGLKVTDLFTVDGVKTQQNWNTLVNLTVKPSTVTYEINGTELTLNGIAKGVVVTIEYTYTVPTTKNGRVKQLVNAVTVNEGGNDPHTPDEVTTPVGQWSVKKELTLVDGEAVTDETKVKAGNKLTYTVTVKNEGNIDLYGLVIADELTGRTGNADIAFDSISSDKGREPQLAEGVLDKLLTGETVTLTYTYDVQDGDMFLTNVATATKGDPDDPDDPSYEEKSEEVKTPVYRDLTITKQWKNEAGEALDNDLLEAMMGADFYITVELYQNGTKIRELVLQAPNWSGSFTDLPATDGNGVPYAYTVKEAGETTAHEVTVTKDGVAYTFTVSGSGSVSNTTSDQGVLTVSLINTLKPNEPQKPEKKAAPTKAELDEVIVFTISRKSHLATETTATITDTLGEFLAYVETVHVKINGVALGTSDYTETTNSQPLTWVIEHVPPMAEIEIQFKAKVTDAAIKYDKLTNSATVDLGDKDDMTTDTDEVTVGMKLPKLKITKTADLKAVQPGEGLTYTLTVENKGEGKAKGVTIKDTLPEYVSFISAEADEDHECEITEPDESGVLTWVIEELEAYGTATLTITVTVNGDTDEPLDVTSFKNIAEITDGMPKDENGKPKEPDPSDPDERYKDEEETLVADLTIAKSSEDNAPINAKTGKKDYAAGVQITYTVTVENIGGVALSNVTVRDEKFKVADKDDAGEPIISVKRADGSEVAISYANGAITFDEAEALAPAEVVTITYTYTITQDDLNDGGVIENAAIAKGDYPTKEDSEEPDGTTDEHEDEHDVFAPPMPSWSVEKVLATVNGEEAAEDVHVTAKDELVYRITVTNTGNVTLNGLAVVDLFQNEAVALTATGDNAALYDATTKTISGLDPEKSIVLEYSYTVDGEEDAFLKNAVTVTGKVPTDPDDPDSPTEDHEESSDVTNVVYRSFDVTKDWTDGSDATLDAEVLKSLIGDLSITIELYRQVGNGNAAAVPGVAPLTLNAGNGWKGTFTDLPAADDEGNEYTYSVKEVINGKTIETEVTIGDFVFTATYGEVEGPDEDGLLTVQITNKLKQDPVNEDPEKTADETSKKDGVGLDDVITYTITRKSYLAKETTATVTDKLPKGLTFDKAQKETYTVTLNGDDWTAKCAFTRVSAEVDADGVTTVTWTIENVPPMAEITITYQAQVNEDALEGTTIENNASVELVKPDGSIDLKETSETVDMRKPDLEIVKEASADIVRPGDALVYTLTVTNNGTGKAKDIVIEDALPDQVTYDKYDVTYGDVTEPSEANNQTVTWEIDELAAGDTETLTIYVTVKTADLLNGSTTIKNVATIEEGDDPEKDPETSEKTVQIVEFTVEKSIATPPKNGTAYALGEKIEYRIVVTNTGDVTLTNVVVTDALLKAAADVKANVAFKLDAASGTITIAELAKGSAATISYIYTVTEKDIHAGHVKNVATVTADDPTDPTPGSKLPPKESEKDVDTEEPYSELVMTKTVASEPKNGEQFVEGEEITFSIAVYNKGNLTRKNVVVNELLKDATFKAGKGYTVDATGKVATIAVILPDETVTLTAVYKVKQQDVVNGSILNLVNSDGGATSTPDPNNTPAPTPEPNPDDPVPTASPTPGAQVEVTPEPPKPAFTITKKVTNLPTPDPDTGESKFGLNDVIKYEILIENKGNVDLTDVIIEDGLENIEIQPNSKYSVSEDGKSVTIAKLPKDGSVTIYAIYKVTEKDILAGHVYNEATGSATGPYPDTTPTPNPDNPPDPDATPTAIPVPVPTPGEVDTDTVPKNGHLTVEKVETSKPALSEGYVEGEKITYEVTVVNDGNLTITDIVVTDELTGDEWKIPSLKPGESATFTAEYVVTQEDILEGHVLNVATATGKSPDPEKPDVPTEPGEVDSKTQPKRGHLKLEKRAINIPAGGRYKLDDWIQYLITVTNDGNLTITDIVVTDKLTGDEWKIPSLEPGESKSFSARHQVTKEDVEAGTVLNVVTAKGKSPDPDNPDVPVDPAEAVNRTEKTPSTTPTYKLTKKATNIPDVGYYEEGQTVLYTITVVNTGSAEIISFVLTDELEGTKVMPGTGYTVKSERQAFITRLAPGASVTVNVSYTITAMDVQRGSVRNIATGAGTGPDGKKAEGNVAEVSVPTDGKLYNVVVHYYYLEDGSQAAPDQGRNGLRPGEEYDFLSPFVDGFWTTTDRVSGTMPAHDVEITVFYLSNDLNTPDGPNPWFIILDEYGVPMSVGNVTRNVGDCFE